MFKIKKIRVHRDILVVTLKRYYRLVEAEKSGNGPVNRERGSRPQRKKRKLEKLFGAQLYRQVSMRTGGVKAE